MAIEKVKTYMGLRKSSLALLRHFLGRAIFVADAE